MKTELISGLFDFNNLYYDYSSLTVKKKGALFYEQDELKLHTSLRGFHSSNISNFLCLINKQAEEYLISPETKPSSKDNKKWIVLKETFPKGYKLRINDIFKIGKIVFKVKHMNPMIVKVTKNDCHLVSSSTIKDEKLKKDYSSINIDILGQTIKTDRKNTSGARKAAVRQNESDVLFLHENKQVTSCLNKVKSSFETCRICFQPNEAVENPLIYGCKCKGTMKYIHLECLRFWFKSKVNCRQISPILRIYTFENLKCELCNHEYSKSVVIKDKVTQLISLDYPDSDCIVLEQITDKERNHIVVIQMENKSIISFGRSAECEVRFIDVSVSRVHAEIHKCSDGYLLHDLNSKFGSLLYLNHILSVCHLNSCGLLINSIKLSISYIKNCVYYLLCFRSNFSLNYDYNNFMQSAIYERDLFNLNEVEKDKPQNVYTLNERDISNYAEDHENLSKNSGFSKEERVSSQNSTVYLNKNGNQQLLTEVNISNLLKKKSSEHSQISGVVEHPTRIIQIQIDQLSDVRSFSIKEGIIAENENI